MLPATRRESIPENENGRSRSKMRGRPRVLHRAEAGAATPSALDGVRLLQLVRDPHGVVIGGVRRTLQILTRAALRTQIAVGPRMRAARERVHRDALHRHPFEDIEVDLLMMRLHRDRLR